MVCIEILSCDNLNAIVNDDYVNQTPETVKVTLERGLLKVESFYPLKIRVPDDVDQLASLNHYNI